MAQSRRYELGVGLLLAGALVVFALMAIQIGALSGLGPTVRVTTRVPDATGLSAGAVVAVAGVEVGTVSALSLDHDRALLELAIAPEHQIRRDAQVRIRARSVLGEKYVELIPQGVDAPVVQDGDVLQSAADPVEIDELVNLLGPIVAAIDPEQVAAAVDGMAAALEEDPARIGRMVDNLDTLLARGAEASEALPVLVDDGKRTLAVARSALVDVEKRAEEAEPMLARADAVLVTLETRTPGLLDQAEGTLAEARALVADSRDDVELILDNFSGIDKWELRRLLREEGIVVRLRSREVAPTDNPTYQKKGQVK